MAEVDFSDFESAKAWFETQTIEVRHLMSSQAALRVSANLCLSGTNHFDTLVLTSFRALLTSAGRGIGRPADVDWVAASSAAYSAVVSATPSRRSAGLSAADAAALSASNAPSNATRSTAGSAHYSAPNVTNFAARSASKAAVFAASILGEGKDLHGYPVWLDITVPPRFWKIITNF